MLNSNLSDNRSEKNDKKFYLRKISYLESDKEQALRANGEIDVFSNLKKIKSPITSFDRCVYYFHPYVYGPNYPGIMIVVLIFEDVGDLIKNKIT